MEIRVRHLCALVAEMISDRLDDIVHLAGPVAFFLNAIAGGKYALGGERIRHREGGCFRRIGGKPQSYPIMHSRV